jgi:2-polyprenyl-6-methoxyphenol hydroxylase-like FAD-dependent oxidoreductase
MPTTQAIVIGGSIAGLLAARVLSEYFDQVTIIERDSLPADDAYRPGTPQARHLHTMLIRGEQILCRLFPGFEVDLQRAGAIQARWGLDNRFCTTGGWTPHFDSGYRSFILSRARLEVLVRARVSGLPQVRFLTETDVTGLLASPDKRQVTGVSIRSRVSQAEDQLPAQLVVDASGRNSKASLWLTRLGYPAPEETLIDAHCGYATRWYKRPDHVPMSVLGVQARPAAGLMRGGGLMPVEDQQVVVTLLGGAGDYPPTDEAGFNAYAQSLADPALYEAIQQLTPISPITGYRRLQNRRLHYERLTRQPEHFLVMGDAAAALNPIYGQGMTKAAMEAEVLQSLLRERDVTNLAGLAARFQRKQASVMKGAWMMATGEDMRFPGVEGSKPWLGDRIGHAYMDWVAQAMPSSPLVTKHFFEVMTLLRPAVSMMRPATLVRVIWHNLRVIGRGRNTPTLQPVKVTT